MSRSKLATVILGGALVVLTAANAMAADRRVVIVNNTSMNMNEFYASSTRQDTWQEDIFGSKMLPAGEQVVVNIDDGSDACVFDFKAVFEGGAEGVQKEANVCELETFTFNE
jgi:hypothetical protein